MWTAPVSQGRGSAMIWSLTPGAGLIVALLLSLGLRGAIWPLAEDGARPIIFYNRFAYCWQPQVKGWTMMVNSIINNWRRKTSDSTGNLGARPSCRPGCVRGDWAGHRRAPDRFLGFGSATNLTGKIEPALVRNRRFESSSLQRRVCEPPEKRTSRCTTGLPPASRKPHGRFSRRGWKFARLAGGGRWIRTSSTAVREPRIFRRTQVDHSDIRTAPEGGHQARLRRLAAGVVGSAAACARFRPPQESRLALVGCRLVRLLRGATACFAPDVFRVRLRFKRP